MKNDKKSRPAMPPHAVPADHLTVPYDPAHRRAPTAVKDSIFHERIPEVVADILKQMIVDDDDARRKQAASGHPQGDYNPIWNILLTHLNDAHERMDKLLEPLEFEYSAGRPLMVIKLGEPAKGWIPNPQHFDKVRKVLKAAGEDKTKNILLYHYGIQIETHEPNGARRS